MGLFNKAVGWLSRAGRDVKRVGKQERMIERVERKGTIAERKERGKFTIFSQEMTHEDELIRELGSLQRKKFTTTRAKAYLSKDWQRTKNDLYRATGKFKTTFQRVKNLWVKFRAGGAKYLSADYARLYEGLVLEQEQQIKLMEKETEEMISEERAEESRMRVIDELLIAQAKVVNQYVKLINAQRKNLRFVIANLAKTIKRQGKAVGEEQAIIEEEIDELRAMRGFERTAAKKGRARRGA